MRGSYIPSGLHLLVAPATHPLAARSGGGGESDKRGGGEGKAAHQNGVSVSSALTIMKLQVNKRRLVQLLVAHKSLKMCKPNSQPKHRAESCIEVIILLNLSQNQE